MDATQRELFVCRILSGVTRCRIKDRIYIVKYPTLDLQYEAQEYYLSIIEENKYRNWYNATTILSVLYKNKLWELDGDSNLKEISKVVDNLKVELYESILHQDQHRQIKQRLNSTRKKQQEMLERRHCLDYITIEGYASYMKNLFIAKHSVYENNKPVQVPVNTLEEIIAKCSEKRLSDNEYRELARTEPWRSYWNSYKSNPFKIDEITDEQKILVLFSNMYDSIYENPEAPSQDIINDDDMLDGWMILNRRKAEKDKKTKEIDDAAGLTRKHKNAQEIFVPVKNAEDAKKIDKLNSTHSKIVKHHRQKLIDSKGHVKQSEFLDEKTKIQMQANQQFVNTAKKR